MHCDVKDGVKSDRYFINLKAKKNTVNSILNGCSSPVINKTQS